MRDRLISFPVILAMLGGSALSVLALAAEPPDARDVVDVERQVVDVPPEIRHWFHNTDGSCVQCSIGMCGVDQNVPEAATLLWDTEYGRAERGGSYPSRVAKYCRERGIRVYNVTGKTTWDWMRWAMETGRGAAIGAGRAHFQTLVGYDADSGTWYVCNNNSPRKIDSYSEQDFRRLHLASGQWVVILDYPPHPARPVYRKWWTED